MDRSTPTADAFAAGRSAAGTAATAADLAASYFAAAGNTYRARKCRELADALRKCTTGFVDLSAEAANG